MVAELLRGVAVSRGDALVFRLETLQQATRARQLFANKKHTHTKLALACVMRRVSNVKPRDILPSGCGSLHVLMTS